MISDRSCARWLLCASLALVTSCRPSVSAVNAAPSSGVEGFGGRIAPRELPEISAADWRSSAAVRRCESGTCRAATSFDDERAPAKMNAWVLEPGTTLRVESDPSVDVLAMLVAGRANASSTEIECRECDADGTAIERWTAVRAASSGLQINVSQSDPPAALVLVIARDAPAQMLASEAPADVDSAAATDASASDSSARSSGPKLVARAASPSRGLFVRPLGDIAWLTWGGGSFRAKIVFDGAQAPRASLGVLVAGASASVAEHTHDRSYELLTAVMADGMVNVWGATDSSLGHQSVVRAGDPQVIVAGVRHAWVGAGTVPLVAVQAYAPGGPEQRFRTLSR